MEKVTRECIGSLSNAEVTISVVTTPSSKYIKRLRETKIIDAKRAS